MYNRNPSHDASAFQCYMYFRIVLFIYYQWMLIPRSSILRNLKVALQSRYNGTYLPDVGVVISWSTQQELAVRTERRLHIESRVLVTLVTCNCKHSITLRLVYRYRQRHRFREQHHTSTLNPFWNGPKNGDIDGTCKQSYTVKPLHNGHFFGWSPPFCGHFLKENIYRTQYKKHVYMVIIYFHAQYLLHICYLGNSCN